jgi:hypothetical protein
VLMPSSCLVVCRIGLQQDYVHGIGREHLKAAARGRKQHTSSPSGGMCKACSGDCCLTAFWVCWTLITVLLCAGTVYRSTSSITWAHSCTRCV